MKITRRQLRTLLLHEVEKRTVTDKQYTNLTTGDEKTRSKSNMGGKGTDDQRSGSITVDGKKYEYEYEKVTGGPVDEMEMTIGAADQIKPGGSYIQIVTSGNKSTHTKFVKGKKTNYNSMGELFTNASDAGLSVEVLNQILSDMDKEDVPMSDELEAEVDKLSEHKTLPRQRLRSLINIESAKLGY